MKNCFVFWLHVCTNIFIISISSEYVVHLKMENRFVWISGTPYNQDDTDWIHQEEEEEEEEKKASQLLRSQKKTIQKQKTSTFHQGKRNTLLSSRYYRAFLYTKQLCDALGIKFLDIYHPLSGPGFDAIRIEGDVHKKRYAWRMKASLLLNGLIEIGKKK